MKKHLKIFKLTDKYRKYPLPEPPFPSLIIYNNGYATGDGYTYVEATNRIQGHIIFLLLLIMNLITIFLQLCLMILFQLKLFCMIQFIPQAKT